MKRGGDNIQAIRDLLIEEATGDVTPGDVATLDGLFEEAANADRNEFMRVAGLVQVACLRNDSRRTESMPDSLRNKLVADAQAGLAKKKSAPVTELRVVRTSGKTRYQNPESASKTTETQKAVTPSPRRTGRITAWSGWAMAACMLLAVFVFRAGVEDRPYLPASQAVIAMQRAILTSTAEDVVGMKFRGVASQGYANVSGDVVWSRDRQRGFLKLEGLPVNDITEAQYQLWIVDPNKDTRPIDGGVFNVVSADGAVYIPIDAAIGPLSPRAWAITLEEPGGVVVSSEPLLIIASKNT